ncbi:MAG: outer membrane protein assembly factor BamA [Bacteroidia bacterium]|nr:outer membrane protein assembly factor BamA [Bacteroidia bacterium]
MKKLQFLCLLLLGSLAAAQAQPLPKDGNVYILSGLEVTGAEFSDKSTIISLSGLIIGEPITIPGIDITDALKRLWKEDIFADLAIKVDNIIGNKIFLVIEVKERPRISQFTFTGISKSQADELREKINFIRGTILTDSKRTSAERIIRNFYIEKGFLNVAVDITADPDVVLKNGVIVTIQVKKNERVKIDEINLVGNEAFPDMKVKRKLKKFYEKKFYRFWAPSKYIPKQYETAKTELITAYNDAGYRDARVIRDTMYSVGDKLVRVEMQIEEGRQYFHRAINWSGNYQYNSEQLQQVLGIKKGDTYSKSKIDKRLFGDPNGSDVSSLYLDDGYLFFNLDPVEALVEGDSIDLEMRVVEGPQATIRKVIIEGNTKTSENVIRRELRTMPGNKFSRSEILRSQRQVLALNYFDQEKLGVSPIPDPASGTVDIKYTVVERPSDQLQLQGGWSGRQYSPLDPSQLLFGGFIGTVQLGFNNFAARRAFQPGAWRPVPSGDGQRLSLAIQLNGANFQNYSFTFMEPWLGGKKPNSLGVSASYLRFQNPSVNTSAFKMAITNVTLDYGRQLKFPDDFFTSRTTLGYKYYDITNPTNRGFVGFENEEFAYVNVFTLRQSFDRASLDAPIYPRSGSLMSFSVEATPPYSAIFYPNRDFSDLSGSKKYNLLEYHKWRFNSNWVFRIAGDLVLSTKIEAGFLGAYNPEIGIPPFERYLLGGSGLQGGSFNQVFTGNEILPLRGYENNSLTNNGAGYPIYNRFVTELRYPISLNQSAPVWVQAFLEGGNGYKNFRQYNPFDLRRAAGGGLRVMLPMVGLLGLDWAYGFDGANDNSGAVSGSQFHFILGQNF